MKKILFVGASTDKHLGIYNDLVNISDVEVCYIAPIYKTGLLGFISRVLLSDRVNKYIRVPYRYLLYNISHKNFNEYSHVLFLNGALLFPHIKQILINVKQSNAKVLLYLLDSLKSGSPIINRTYSLIKGPYWDKVYTFDKNDAKENGFYFIGFYYYSKLIVPRLVEKCQDMYFIGGLKGGREKLIEDVFHRSTEKNVNVQFDVMTYGRDDINRVQGINYRNGWISYSTVVEHVSKSNCILDIRQENQVGPSFRYFEAICYNKKLLTNNPNIVNLPLYNPRWMKVFSTIDDIDWDWVKQVENIDYNYNGEFSPINLVEYLRNNE